MLKKLGWMMLITILVSTLFLPQSQVQAASSNKVYVVSKVNDLNIRSDARMGTKILGKLNKGQKLQRLGSKGAWTQVYYKKKKAWVATSYVTTTGAKKQSVGKTYTMKASAYTPYCKGCSGKTALGWNVLTQKRNVVAVDPRVIPLGTKVQVYVGSKLLGTYTAADTGGAIKGNKIDILMYSHSAAIQFGRKTVTVKVL